MVSFLDVLSQLLLFGLVFGMSATVDINNMREQIKNRNAILSGIFLQFGILPLLGFCVVRFMNLSHGMGITLLVVTSSPGGSYSNWWCSLFNADLALSVTMTAISTLLSCIALPANLLLYTKYSYEEDVVQNLHWTALFVSLAVVISGIALGLFCSAKVHSHKFNIMANRIGNFAGIALVIFSATMTNTGSADTKIWSRDWDFYVGVAAPCLAGLLIANVLTTVLNLMKPERVTVSVECCYQNVGIATSVALTMFNGDELNEAMGVPFFYGVVEAVVLGVYCIIMWKFGWTKAPRDAPFWKVIVTSYEVLEAEQRELDAVEINVSDSSDGAAPPDEHTNQQGNVLTTYFSMDGFDVLTTNKKKEPSGMRESDTPIS